MVFETFFIDLACHATPFNTFFLTDIGTISVQYLTGIVFIYQGLKFLGVMRWGTAYGVCRDEFCRTVDFYMIFVTLKNDVVLFDPASIDIFLP